MTDLRKAAEEALEALEYDFDHDPRYAATGNIEALRKRYALIEVLRAALQREALNEVHQMDHENRDADELDMIGGWS